MFQGLGLALALDVLNISFIVYKKESRENVHFLHAGRGGAWPACECPDETSALCPGNYGPASHPEINERKMDILVG